MENPVKYRYSNHNDGTSPFVTHGVLNPTTNLIDYFLIHNDLSKLQLFCHNLPGSDENVIDVKNRFVSKIFVPITLTVSTS